jgi:DNA-binding LacI/PurR family transcriptional regulator
MPNLLQYQVDAIVLTSATISSAMTRICASRDTPVVSFNRYVPGLEIHAVSSDNIAGARQVADFLVTTGHERLAFISGQRDATTNRDRQTGFATRLKQLKIRSYTQEEGGDFSYEAGYATAKRLLRRTTRPDALFFACDVMAVGGIDAAREIRLSVPENVSIVGYDDVPLTALPCYSLTTIRQPIREMAKAAVDLLNLGEDRDMKFAPTTRVIMGDLITRTSTLNRRTVQGSPCEVDFLLRERNRRHPAKSHGACRDAKWTAIASGLRSALRACPEIEQIANSSAQEQHVKFLWRRY